jgi:hypothetical protein
LMFQIGAIWTVLNAMFLFHFRMQCSYFIFICNVLLKV